MCMGYDFADHSLNCFKCTSPHDGCVISSFFYCRCSFFFQECSTFSFTKLVAFPSLWHFLSRVPTMMLSSSILQQVRSYWFFVGVPFRISLAEKILLRSCSKEMSFEFQIISICAFSKIVAFPSRLISPEK